MKNFIKLNNNYISEVVDIIYSWYFLNNYYAAIEFDSIARIYNYSFEEYKNIPVKEEYKIKYFVKLTSKLRKA